MRRGGRSPAPGFGKAKTEPETKAGYSRIRKIRTINLIHTTASVHYRYNAQI
jgi:hypothetical protein